jgi:hypothetical protein
MAMKSSSSRLNAILLFSLTMVGVSASATTVKIRVTDPTGIGIHKALVITTSLERGKGEISRDLTGPDGFAPPLDLPPGKSEVLAMYPRGVLKMMAQDFVVTDKPISLDLPLGLKPVAGQTVIVNGINLHIRVLDPEGHPVPEAWVIGRDLEAKRLDVVLTDAQGKATVRIPTDGAEVTAIHDGRARAQRINIKTRIAECGENSDCVYREMERIRKKPLNLTIRLR